MQQPFITQLTELFTTQADLTLKPRQEAYMRHQFTFFGVNQTKRLAIQKMVFKAHQVNTMDELAAITSELWQLRTREYCYTAMDLLQKYHALWQPETLKLFKWCIETNPWWDTLDNLASNCVGKLCVKFPKLVHEMDKWIVSENMWLRRAALLHQLKYKKATDTERLFAYCQQTMHEKEFFIRKAIGWALREYSKTDPLAVTHFVACHEQTLSGLSKREALKRTVAL